MFFLELSCFLDDSTDVGNLISDSAAFSKSSLNIWKFTVYVLLKSGLENFVHYFGSVLDEWNCMVVWTFFAIAFFWGIEMNFSDGSVGKKSTCNAGDMGWESQGWEDPLEKDKATYSSILAWRIPWTEESGRLQSTGLQRVRPIEQLHFHFASLWDECNCAVVWTFFGISFLWNCNETGSSASASVLVFRVDFL